jgi:hypothetical protein
VTVKGRHLDSVREIITWLNRLVCSQGNISVSFPLEEIKPKLESHRADTQKGGPVLNEGGCGNYIN